MVDTMAELKDILTDIAKFIVEEPDQVSVEQAREGSELVLTLHVAPDDMGKVIGRHGKISRSIRVLMKAAASAADDKVRVEIR